jgi:two-component system, sensor histidine kinase RegB
MASMMLPPPFTLTPALAPTRENLQRLVLLRYVTVAIVAVAVAVANRLFDMAWDAEAVGVGLGFLVLANLATQFRLRRGGPPTNQEFFGHLLLDVVVLTLMLRWSGGSENPLVSLYLMPLVIAAAVLPAGYAWFMAGLTVACYTGLMWLREEHAVQHHHDANVFDFHLIGMWLTFALSGALIAFFVGRMGRSLREGDRRLAVAREESLRNERIIALGTMAAGAAHELGTPLATMKLLADELAESLAKNSEARQDMEEIRRQIDNCKRIITDLLASAGQNRGEGGSPQSADNFLQEVVSKWQVMRPAVRFDYRWDATGPVPEILAEQTLSQAVINLLNNAADASPEHIEIEGRCLGEEMVIEIRDHGPGLTREVMERAGEPFFTTKGPGKGTGLGLFLANATIERFGGTVRLFNREERGACTEVRIPLLSLLA